MPEKGRQGSMEDMRQLSAKKECFFWKEIEEICAASRMEQSKQYCQHGMTSVYSHSLSVAYESCCLAERFHLQVDYHALIRGAFLHDYFLYDWHDREHKHKRPHGFYHPGVALQNAMEDFTLSKIEKDIIKKHMFPLTVVPPSCLEAWIVCLADKVCSTRETVQRRKEAVL